MPKLDLAKLRQLSNAAEAVTVHVFGVPDDMALQPNERTCEQADDLEPVVYHVGSVKLSSGDWTCKVCGYSTVAATDNLLRICNIQ